MGNASLAPKRTSQASPFGGGAAWYYFTYSSTQLFLGIFLNYVCVWVCRAGGPGRIDQFGRPITGSTPVVISGVKDAEWVRLCTQDDVLSLDATSLEMPAEKKDDKTNVAMRQSCTVCWSYQHTTDTCPLINPYVLSSY
jgi:hypothetical protein